jgi:hypothetical protein
MDFNILSALYVFDKIIAAVRNGLDNDVRGIQRLERRILEDPGKALHLADFIEDYDVVITGSDRVDGNGLDVFNTYTIASDVGSGPDVLVRKVKYLFSFSHWSRDWPFVPQITIRPSRQRLFGANS